MIATYTRAPEHTPWTENETVTWEDLAKSASYNGQQLSSLLGVSLRTLQRHFSNHYGITLAEFLSQLRMHEALRRLNLGHAVKVVCYDLGFKQVSHFSRVFKRFYGAPPSLWLRSPMESLVFRDGSPLSLNPSQDQRRPVAN